MSEATPFGQGCTLCAEDMAAAIIRYKREGQAIPLQTGMISPPRYCPSCGRALTREARENHTKEKTEARRNETGFFAENRHENLLPI